MHSVSITHTNTHNFHIKIDGVSALLSYKSFGGRKAVEEIGSAGVAHLIDEAEHSIFERDFSAGCRGLFNAVGASNAMTLLDVCCKEAFIDYWADLVCYRQATGQGVSFRNILAIVGGTKATMTRSRNPLVEKLKQICMDPQHTDDTVEPIIPKEEILGECVRVAFLKQTNNTLIFLVNGKAVSLCTKNANMPRSVAEVLSVVNALEEVLSAGSELQVLIERWGGTFVFRLLHALYADKTVTYFRIYAEENIQQRIPVEPRKILKKFGFPFNDDKLKSFGHEILTELEHVRNDTASMLEAGNVRELYSDKNCWILFYNESMYRRLDFTEITHPNLRNEAMEFLRTYFQSNGEKSVSQVARYFYLIRSGLNALAETNILSIHDTTLAHVRFIKSSLQSRRTGSANHISEVLQAMGRMFHWAVPQCDVEDNPFWCIDIPNKIAFLETTVPADEHALRIIADHLEELPEYIQLGHQLLLLTVARAHDVFGLFVSDIEYLDDGTGVLRFISSKNNRRMQFFLPADITQKLIDYIAKTVSLRESAGTDHLFLYRQNGLRGDSQRKPCLLNRTTYNYYIQKLLDRYGDCYHVTTRQIRAEGGRRYHSEGMPSSHVALALGNTPTVAKKHYRTLSPRDEAELYHRAYVRYFATVPMQTPRFSEQQHLLWGSCKKPNCRQQNDCKTCPYLCAIEEVDDIAYIKSS